MKKTILFACIISLVSCSKPSPYDCPIAPKSIIHTEDMPSLVKRSNDVRIVLSDDVDGRQTYNVIFPDNTIIESMYAEEIANGLITGQWDYNEDLNIN